MKLSSSQFTKFEKLLTDILGALSPIVPEIEELKHRVGKLEGETQQARVDIKDLQNGKLPTSGLITIDGTVDGVPAVILGGYVGTWIGPGTPEDAPVGSVAQES